MEYIIGNTYKITGGKHKKHGTGTLTKFNKTYSSIKVEMGVLGSIGTGEGLAAITADIKVKNCYLHPVDEGVIEMPEADELQQVQGNPDDFVVMEDLAPDEQDQIEAIVDEETEEEEPNFIYEGHGAAAANARAVKHLKGKAEHFESEYYVALAERDQADAKVNDLAEDIEQHLEAIDTLSKRNKYLEEIVRKLLLP
jgi:uncharacterized protein YoxC|tara:strand:+ start:210 stop:800 length:591 start_codon:yes stop_codon:yes gene_type:complete